MVERGRLQAEEDDDQTLPRPMKGRGRWKSVPALEPKRKQSLAVERGAEDEEPVAGSERGAEEDASGGARA